jgi:hypothetical protein
MECELKHLLYSMDKVADFVDKMANCIFEVLH